MTDPGITQRQIAERLGVSQALVSRALSGTSGRIQASAATVTRIRSAAERWGYQPSVAAQSLRGGRTAVLAVVVKRFEDPYFGRLLSELERLAAVHGYALVLTGPATPAPTLLRHRPEGIILVGSDFEPEGLERLRDGEVRFARIGTGPRSGSTCCVSMNQPAALDALCLHLRALGHRTCGFIGDDSPTNRRRAADFGAALARAGMERPRGFELCLPAGGADVGYDAMRRWLEASGPRPTAVVAAEDVLALAALRALHERGVTVPADLSLAGIDDVPFARLATPSLTTLRQPVELMVQHAFAHVTGTGSAGQAVAVEAKLIVRESTGRPRRPA